MSLSPADIEAACREADLRRAFWHEHHAEFLAKHPDQFVAVVDSVVVATSPDLLELERLLKRKGLKMTDTWVEFFDSNPNRIVIL